MTNLKISKKIFNTVYLPYLTDYSKRDEIYYGGAGSGKSVFIVQKLIIKLLNDPGRLLLVVRKTQASLRDSCFSLFKQILYDWQIGDECRINKTNLEIELPNDSKIIFKGMDDDQKIKSINGITDIFCEEVTELEEVDFDQLHLRLRNKKKKNNQVFSAFNPVSKASWIYKRYFSDAAEVDSNTTMILQTTYRDNKFLPQDYIDNLLAMKKTNYAYYKIYAEGEFSSLDKKVYNNWEEKIFDYKELLKNSDNRPIYGLDWGYVHDPTAIVCSVINEITKEIWVYDVFTQKGMTNEEIFIQLQEMQIHNARIVCDSAEQKSIEDLRRLGCKRVVACSKGRDSILNGINLINEYHVYVLPKLSNFKEELLNYTWQKDRQSGEYINKPIDKFNHCMDAFRYSVMDAVQYKTTGFSIIYR